MTQSEPTLAPPWLTLGALELELHHPKEATAALETYVRLVEAGGAVTIGAAPPADSDDDTPSTPSNALTQAWLLLSQAAEQQKDFSGAERWLARIDNPQRALEVQARRASLLARQGRMAEARELIRVVPEQSPSDARAKLLAEAELLREQQAMGRCRAGADPGQQDLPGRHRPALRAGDDRGEARPHRRDGAAAAPGHRPQARPASTPTTRSAIRSPSARSAFRRHAR